ncbi:MAG: FkbM family methyltransferase [Cyanobacteria bacterium P01_A01_bin.40]
MVQLFSNRLNKNAQRVIQALQKQKISTYTIQKQIGDVAFDFLIADADAREWYDNSDSIEETSLSAHPEYEFIKELTQPGDIIFECGTHHGLTAILLSHWVGTTGKVIAFEINPRNAQIARQNIELNQLENITLEQKGLGSESTKLQIFNKSNSSVTPANIISVSWLKNFLYGTEEAEIITLDDYAQASSFMPTFLKIDVEGYESEVLKGATEILQTLPKLEIEIHTEILSRYHTSVKEIFELINIENYQTWIQWNDEEKPEKFDLQQKIDHRVHLFAIPKNVEA